MKYHQNQKGNTLLYIIATMTILTALGTGAFYMTNTSSFSGLSVSAQNKAKYLAEAGIRYALANLRTLQNTTLPLTYTYILNTNSAGVVKDEFILKISGNFSAGPINIYSTGVSNLNTPYEASHQIKFENITLAQYQSLINPPFSFAGAGSGGISSMTTNTGTSGTPGSATGPTGVFVDTVNQQITLGAGSGTGVGLSAGTTGAVWYQGWADINGSACINGNCNFNQGIRAYFDFQYSTPWQGEGFTFAIISGHYNGPAMVPAYINDYTACGGGLGEYMAYAGPGISPPGYGIQPPKIAVEFDPFLNLVPPPISPDPSVCTSNPSLCSDNPNVCSSTCYGIPPVCSSNSRNDNTFWLLAPPSLNNPIFLGKHSTFVYWGDNQNYCSTGSNTYDDNRHGAGIPPDNPKNPDGSDINPGGTTYPYMIQDFDTFGTVITPPPNGISMLSFRLEIDRMANGQYKMRAWLKPYAVAGYPDSNNVMLNDTSKKYSAAPTFQQTITMSQASGWHDNFDRILFGWTQATDPNYPQTVNIQHFQIDFKNRNDF